MAATDPRGPLDGEPLGVGVVGAGGILRVHALAYRALPELARLRAVADIDLSRAEAARRAHGFEAACADPRELLEREDVDVVDVCTRPNTHARLIRDALRAGKHVLCEKPMAHTLADADEILAACEAHPGSKVSFLYQWRSDPAVAHLRELLEQNHLGRVLMADLHVKASRPDAYYESAAKRSSWEADGGGMLIVIAIHQLDLLIHLLGDPVEVSAQMDTFLKPTEGEDTAVGWVRFADGALATLRCSVCEHEADNFSIDLLAANAAVRLTGGARGGHPSPFGCRWRVEAGDRDVQRQLRSVGFDRSPPPPREKPRLVSRLQEEWHRRRGGTWIPPRHWWHGPSVAAFLEAVRSDAPVAVPAREARRSLELVGALYQSALSGAPVGLPLDETSPVYKGVDPNGFGPRKEGGR